MEKKSYLGVLAALEQFVAYAMKFSLKKETPSGETKIHKISGIRIAYQESDISQQMFSEGEDYGLKRVLETPEVLVTLFYDHYFEEKGVKKSKHAVTSKAFSSQVFSGTQGLLRYLKAGLPYLVDSLFDDFYAAKMEDNAHAIEVGSKVEKLADAAFEVEYLTTVPQELSKKVCNLTQELYQIPCVSDATFTLSSQRKLWIVVDHRGQRIINKRDLCVMSMSLVLVNHKKEQIDFSDSMMTKTFDEMDQNLPKVRDQIQNFLFSKERKQLESGIYPLIFAPSAVGTLFHEALAGHMLSGRYIAEGTSTVFKSKIGKQIATDGFMEALKDLEIWDCPRDEKMLATYTYDMEGSPSQDVLLIDRGMVKAYLHSKNSAAWLTLPNNGHSLSGSFIGQCSINDQVIPVVRDPEPRVSNLKIIGLNTISLEDIKQVYFDAFGYYLWVESKAGEVLVDSGTFELEIESLVKVYPDGRKEYFHGGKFSANLTDFLGSIEIVSDYYGRSQGFCGAESGWVPTEELAPAMAIYGVNWIPDDVPERDLLVKLKRDKHLSEEQVPQGFEY